MRDLLAFAAIFLFLPMALSNAFVAYLLWGWAGLIALSSYVFGFMGVVPLVQVFALLTLGALLMRSGGDKFERIELNRTSVLMILFATHGLFVALFAYPGLGRNWELFGNVAKTVLFCLLMPVFVTSRYRIHAMVVMVALATSFHGALDGLKFIASGGAHNARGIPKFGDNNHFAMVLLMALPMLYYLFQVSAQKLTKLGFAVMLPLIAFAVVATASRGALIGLCVIVFWILMKSRQRLIGIVLVAISAAVVVQLAPESWSQRMETIGSAKEDDSLLGRFGAWKVSSAIAVANPIVGGGFRAVQSSAVWDAFKDAPNLLPFVEIPPFSLSGVAAHSIWFEVMGDMGFVGILLFMALIANAFLTLREIRKMVRIRGPSLRWASDLADMLGAALLAYVVTGSLLSAAYFELPYIFMMLMEVLKQFVRKQVAMQEKPPIA
ncbi:putative O-glycosylation ligase, exosortase A system-associated [Hydrogenophaga sp. 2FB]|uniref:putative O-glycosylation ligase, exosortase A system-associated n=1 Tax=Hydrogenophaga sp. 2FB TaxID=2502187 RepID=UPI0010F50F73|nr:putative O-glycosylation ligase, exosortase A system-associated [Hydrogenophaga sp. 2FB]